MAGEYRCKWWPVSASLVLATLLAGCSGSDDGVGRTPPDITVHSIALPEGAQGENTAMRFRVTTTSPLRQDATIRYRTSSGSASEGVDYTGTAGELNMRLGDMEAAILIELIGDDEEEPAEHFTLELSADDRVNLTARTAIGTVANDDSACVLPFLKEPNPWLVGDGDPLNYAHRGGVIDFPENTLYAYKQVAAAGADVLEMDVYQTADGELVIIHDLDVDRTTNGSGLVGEMTLAELQALDAAWWFVPGQGTPHDAPDSAYEFRGIATGQRPPPPGFTADDFRIPTLEQALMAFPDKLINVELKPDLDGVGNYEQQIADLLVRYGRFDNLIAASFIDDNLFAFKRVAPCIHTSVPLQQATGLVLGSFGQGTIPPVPEHVAFQVPPDTSQVEQVPDGITVVTADLVRDAHAANMAVQVWTINTCQQMLELMALGVDAIMTDRPLLLQSLLDQPVDQRSCD